MISPTGKGIRMDEMGDGHFGSKRGNRKHMGIDFLARSGQAIVMPFDKGEIVRRAYPYSDSKYEGFVIRGMDNGRKVRAFIFYAYCTVPFAKQYTKGTVIGKAQDIAKRYNDPKKPKMKNHVHMEVYKRYNYETDLGN